MQVLCCCTVYTFSNLGYILVIGADIYVNKRKYNTFTQQYNKRRRKSLRKLFLSLHMKLVKTFETSSSFKFKCFYNICFYF